MAYKMVAERDDQKVIKERASALIVLANARVWESEGWQVMITDAEGTTSAVPERPAAPAPPRLRSLVRRLTNRRAA